MPDESAWLAALSEPPFELELDSKQSDHDVAAALTVFTVLNDARVEKAELAADGTLQLYFEGERRLDFPGQVEQLVWAWKVEWGQLVMICKGGEFFSSHS
ncbi:hypothetical protein [Enhygromyxa salina]|uniref:hypothetical protein n=1 Tax=Enhygromyxa salina TaxID=215803 RepID=UPI0011B248C9|nr:hypothetical protein [Enhygromyxa salina]